MHCINRLFAKKNNKNSPLLNPATLAKTVPKGYICTGFLLSLPTMLEVTGYLSATALEDLNLN